MTTDAIATCATVRSLVASFAATEATIRTSFAALSSWVLGREAEGGVLCPRRLELGLEGAQPCLGENIVRRARPFRAADWAAQQGAAV